MLMEQLRAVANAVLYEGYMLYPYRPSALKNQRRGWSFGALLPPAYAAANPGESCEIRSQVLASAAPAAEFSIEARFLQLSSPSLAEQAVDGIVERSIIARATLASLLDQCQQLPFTFPTLLNTTIEGLLEVSAEAISDDAARISLSFCNSTHSPRPLGNRDEALPLALIAAHIVVAVDNGEFFSLLDPPQHLQSAAASCRQAGVFPVLAGSPAERSAMLLSPVILYDYPRIAPESRGDFFDGSEIDEMLTLRVLTLTEAEKEEMRSASACGRGLLQRTESTTPEDVLRLHGTFRDPGPAKEEQ